MRLTENGQKVFDARYAQRDEKGNAVEAFAQAVYRLARTAAGAENENQKVWEEKFASVIGDLFFIPSTPIWANMGKDDRPWQPGACFVLSVEDSLESMYDTLKNTAMVFKSGGGVGYNFSTIRPKGSLVRSTKGKASGVVELVKLYDASSNMVMQGGVRRGASMGILNIDHPEIPGFICAKLEGGLTNFNLSVGVTDAYMEALQKDEEWQLAFDGKVYQTLRARELWDLISQSAHACGDPGIIFVDRLQQYNPVPGNMVNCTNPCVTSDTWVLTREGPRQVLDLVGRPFEAIVNGRIYKTGEKGFFKTGLKPVVRLQTREGYSVRLTSDHLVLRVAGKTRFHTSQEWAPAGELKPGDRVILHNHRPLAEWPGMLTENEGYLLGLLVGDGTLKTDAAILSVWSKKQAVNYPEGRDGAIAVMNHAVECTQTLRHRSDFTGWVSVKGRSEYRLKLGSIRTLAENAGMSPGNKTVTPGIEVLSSSGYRGFLRGLFDADGTVVGNQRKGASIRLAQSDYGLLSSVQRMLLRLGIVSKIYKDRRPAGKKCMPDGKGGQKEYWIKAQHELVVSKENICVFEERVGFCNSEKAGKLKEIIGSYKRRYNQESFTAILDNVAPDGVEEVFDVQVPGVNAFDANGFYVHNCGEQPLSPGESCLLGSINLARMMTADGQLNRQLLANTVHTAVRFLDNLIDVAQYPLLLIEKATKATRKVGLGFTGLHDALIMAGLPYDSKEGRQFAGEITRYIQTESHHASRELAEEKGCFPDWENSIYHPLDKRRNAACITIAPTGSVTAMAGCEGYGVEPIFAVAYTKQTNVAGDFEIFSPLFLEACRKLRVHQEVLSEVARQGTCQNVQGIPESIARIFKGAQDIAFEDHILMQAEVQKYVENAVSKTINLPSEATPDDIERCYRLAYELNLKGITVFRDGCKKGTVTVGKGKDQGAAKELRRGDILPRPLSAHGVTHRLDTGCGKIYLTVNYQTDNGEILETFITTGSDGGCLVYTEATSRLISLAIRGGLGVDEIIEQLTGTHSCPSYMMARGRGKSLSPGKSCASAIAKKLAEIKAQLIVSCNGYDGMSGQVEEYLKCDVCGNKLNMAEGCLVCRNCGFSKC